MPVNTFGGQVLDEMTHLGAQVDPAGESVFEEPMANPYLLDSIVRVMRVLDEFATDGEELRLTDLSERLGLSKPQVMRIVSTLEHGGYLTRDPETKRYRLGLRLLELGTMVRQQLDVRRAAQPVLRKLAEATEETVGLFVPDRSGPICVEVIESPHGLRVFAQQGRRMPWNAGASAKVLLAFMSEKEREAILSTTRFKRYTSATVVDADLLRDVLCQIRADGYYFSTEDLDMGIGGVAAPIFDHEERVAGALAVSAPVIRLEEQDSSDLVAGVLAGSREISLQLGYCEDRSRVRATAVR